MKSTLFLFGALALSLCVAKESIDVSQWNYNTGYTFCLYAYSAYCPSSELSDWSCKWCQHNSTVTDFKTTAMITADGEFVYVGYNAEYSQIIVSFRGSTDLLNWINNLDATQTKYPYCDGCEVHSGFYSTWKSVKDQTLAAMYDLHKKYPKYEIVTTGHSLGGALSTLASVDVYMNISGAVPVYSWTLGSPRVGNGKFANWYQDSSGIKHSQRIVNWHDEVPHLPTEQLLLDTYRHVVQEVWEQKDVNNFILCSATDGEDPSCSDSVIERSIYDHLHYFGLEESCN